MPLLVGLILSTLLAVAAFMRGSLNVSGAFGATVVGTSIYVGGGLPWWLTLFAFFLTSTLLGRVGKSRKAGTKNEFSKGDRRDIWQVLANGGVASVSAVMYIQSGEHVAWMGAFVGALATCNADTWATELGILSRGEPILITTGRRVVRGTSGGISMIGTMATVAGGVTIGAVSGLFGAAFHEPAITLGSLAILGGAAGLVGSLVDSLLGATTQSMYLCPICESDTEQAIHHCGATTQHARGIRVVNNDVVNLFASATGALVGALLVSVLP